MLGKWNSESEIIISINIWRETEDSLEWELVTCGIIARDNDQEGEVWFNEFDTITEVEIVSRIEDCHLIVDSQLKYCLLVQIHSDKI